MQAFALDTEAFLAGTDLAMNSLQSLSREPTKVMLGAFSLGLVTLCFPPQIGQGGTGWSLLGLECWVTRSAEDARGGGLWDD